RVIIGARVAFFAPFLQRSIETAVGMWVAIAIVAVGLLSWSAWLPLLLCGARNVLAGQIALRTVAWTLVRVPVALWNGATSPGAGDGKPRGGRAIGDAGRRVPAPCVGGNAVAPGLLGCGGRRRCVHAGHCHATTRERERIDARLRVDRVCGARECAHRTWGRI